MEKLILHCSKYWLIKFDKLIKQEVKKMYPVLKDPSLISKTYRFKQLIKKNRYGKSR